MHHDTLSARDSQHDGRQLGPYHVIAFLGAGGMGEVYKARDTRLARDVALKILPSAFTTDPARLARFKQEARTAAALNHPKVVTVYDVCVEDGVPWIVMELLEGETLRSLLHAGALLLPRGD